jgi:hypothetical protein
VNPPPARDAGGVASADAAAAWFLTADERGNPATAIDAEHGDGQAWTAGNRVTVHVDGVAYLARLHQLLSRLEAGDGVYLTDWRIDATRRLAGPGTELGPLLAGLARRGVAIRGLLWRSHPALVRFNQDANRVLSTLVNRAGAAQGISATPIRSASTPATGGGRPGTTSSWSCTARPCWTSTSPSGNAGRTAPPPTTATRCGPCGGGSATNPDASGCCSACCPHPRSAPMPCRCSAPILPGAGRSRSPATGAQLGLEPDDGDGRLLDPAAGFELWRTTAARLEAWHDGDGRGPRPPGRVRPHQVELAPALKTRWAAALNRVAIDPDGRPLALRRDTAPPATSPGRGRRPHRGRGRRRGGWWPR